MRVSWAQRTIVVAFLLVAALTTSLVVATYFPLDRTWSVQNSNALVVKQGQTGESLRIIFKDEYGDYALAFFDINGTSPSSNPTNSFILAIVLVPQNTGSDLWTVVWSANRNRPVAHNATLAFNLDGNLALWDGYGEEVWSTDCSAGILVTGLEVDTSGNLVLYDATSTSLWESFDHPTDTILPGQVLHVGASLVANSSGTDASLPSYQLVVEHGGVVLYARSSSSSASSDPLGLQPPTLLPYWVSSLNLVQNLDGVLPMCQHPAMVVLDNTQGLLVTYDLSLTNPSGSTSTLCSSTYLESTLALPKYGQTNVSHQFVRLDADGNLRLYVYTVNSKTWHVVASALSSRCDLPGTCGKYGVCFRSRCNCSDASSKVQELLHDEWVGDSLSGSTPGASPLACKATAAPAVASGFTVQSSPANCTADAGYHQEIFIEASADYFSNQYVSPDYYTPSFYECGKRCLDSCSCAASFHHNASGACFLVAVVHSLQRASQPGYSALVKVPSPIRPPPPAADTQDLIVSRKRTSESILIGVSVGLGCVGLCLVFALWMLHRFLGKKKGRVPMQKFRGEEAPGEEDVFLNPLLPGLPPRFTLKELSVVTSGFQSRLGGSSSGVFGPVYEGSLVDGTKVTVKRLDASRQLGLKEFRVELAIIGGIHHLNLVQMKGYCIDGIHRLLVYEYVAKGSLDKWLFAPKEGAEEFKTDGFVLDWNTRFKIALGTARGLGYLHEECSSQIIHMDVKPQNIMLDEQFFPKVSNAGLSKLIAFDREDSEISGEITIRRGTPGYLAPELLLRAQVSEKIDIYSYGVVLIELLTGRKSIDLFMDFDSDYFPSWAMNMARDGRLRDALDKRLGDLVPEMQCQRVIQIAYWCVHRDFKRRPTMKVVVQMLEGLVAVPEMPDAEPADLTSFKLLSRDSFNERKKKLAASSPAQALPTPSGSEHPK